MTNLDHAQSKAIFDNIDGIDARGNHLVGNPYGRIFVTSHYRLHGLVYQVLPAHF
jgi:hypothetical protein